MAITAQSLLKQYYGYDDFRPGQAKVINSLMAGRDVLAIMPTGAGKSLCFQIPALLLPGVTLVVSPLISLMKDQVDALKQQGVEATYINSSLTSAQTRQRLSELAAGKYKLIYVAPERLELSSFQAVLQSIEVSLVAIDEAHCVSQWGHDFRPSYRNIRPFVSSLPRRPVVGAFTATATSEVKNDIIASLALHKPDVYVTGFDRPNLFFSVLHSENKQKFVLNYLEANESQAGIIYASTRREVEELYAFLRHRGYAAGRYHAGLDESERTAMQEQFLYDDVRVMVATNAFGMGIDKSNVRYVIHYNMPRNLEAYYQEAGRSGRDGEPGDCIMLFSKQDIMVQKFLIEKSVEHPQRRLHELRKLQDMVDYCQTSGCLRHYILRYFGQQPERDDCGKCGSCAGGSRKKAANPPQQSLSKGQHGAGEELFDLLRQVRKQIALRDRIPPYVVFADSTLREMCLHLPVTESALRRIKGVGELKLARYGREFLGAINSYLQSANAKDNLTASKDVLPKQSDKPSHIITLEMYRQGIDPRAIAKRRGITLNTLRGHLIRCQNEGHDVEWQ